MTASERFADWALGLSIEDVPKPVVDTACRHLLDGLGCALAAARTGAAEHAVTVATEFASGGAHIIGTRSQAPAPAAALANGALVHALDYDDTHAGALVHATAAVLPTAFVIGEVWNSSGADVLAAAIAGYEVVTRLGAAVPHGFHQNGFHATSVCGVFASALIASKLMDLTRDQTVNALGIAGSTAGGLLEFLHTGSSTKQLHPGMAAMNGIIAARLAVTGADGPSSVFEGELGLFRSFTGKQVDAATLTDGLGRRWETTRMTIKPYPVCQLSHASLDALRTLLPVDPVTVEAIAFGLMPEIQKIVCEPADAKRRPRTPYEGKFSLPYCAATLLLDGDVTIDSFAPENLTRPDALDLASRITWVPVASQTAPADAPGDVMLHLKDGTSRHARVERSRGGPETPLSDDELVAKFKANGGLDRHVEEMFRLAELPNVRGIL